MPRKYIGVWTCKGGVGKTTVSAHLAGAFALCGYNVMLLDLDPQRNLRKMLGDNLIIRSKNSGTIENRITVKDYSEWDEFKFDERVVICDCNPNTGANPAEMIRKFDYCIIPLLLTPLGINKNCAVINETCAAINRENRHAKIFIVINNYIGKDKTKSAKLNTVLKIHLEQSIQDRNRYFYIDPFKDFAIRHNPSLMYWGYETVVDAESQQLAFTTKGNSVPKEDFLQLAEYIQLHTGINEPR